MLNDDKRVMGRTAAKEPAAFGRIKQRALELGMSTDEYILAKDAQLNNQQTPTDNNKELADIKRLLIDLLVNIKQNAAPAPHNPSLIPREIVKGVVNVNNEQINKVIKEIPNFIKDGIKNDEISLNDATNMVLSEAKTRNLPVSKEDITRIYNGVKDEAAQKEKEKAAQKEKEKDE